MGKCGAGARVKARIERGELEVAGGSRPKAQASSKRNWSRDKEKAFLSALAETCNVTLAAAEAGISPSGAYQRRRSDARFRAGWGEALAIAYHKLELILLERALNGTEKWSPSATEAKKDCANIPTSSRWRCSKCIATLRSRRRPRYRRRTWRSFGQGC